MPIAVDGLSRELLAAFLAQARADLRFVRDGALPAYAICLADKLRAHATAEIERTTEVPHG